MIDRYTLADLAADDTLVGRICRRVIPFDIPMNSWASTYKRCQVCGHKVWFATFQTRPVEIPSRLTEVILCRECFADYRRAYPDKVKWMGEMEEPPAG